MAHVQKILEFWTLLRVQPGSCYQSNSNSLLQFNACLPSTCVATSTTKLILARASRVPYLGKSLHMTPERWWVGTEVGIYGMFKLIHHLLSRIKLVQPNNAPTTA